MIWLASAPDFVEKNHGLLASYYYYSSRHTHPYMMDRWQRVARGSKGLQVGSNGNAASCLLHQAALCTPTPFHGVVRVLVLRRGQRGLAATTWS